MIRHFGAETQGFQGLVDQNERGKAYVHEKSHFLREAENCVKFFFYQVNPQNYTSSRNSSGIQYTVFLVLN